MSNNTHPGLSYSLNGPRRYPAPPTLSNASNKAAPPLPSSSLSHHASPYQPQSYTPQQPPQGAYANHLFSTPPPSVNGVSGSQHGPRQPPQHQVSPALPGSRQRAAPSRQMQPQVNQTPQYLHQALNPQPLNPQQLSQQPMSQPSISQPSLAQQSLGQQQLGQQQLGQQSLGQQSLGQQQAMGQQHSSQHPNQHATQHSNQPPLNPQQLSQQSLNQHSLNQQSLNQQQSLPQQSLTHQSSAQSAQQNDNPLLSQQSTPHPQGQAAGPLVTSQVPHMQQQQQLVQQVQALQQASPAQPEPLQTAQQAQHQHNEIELASQDGDGDMSLDTKQGNGSPSYVAPAPKGPMMSAPPEGGDFPTFDHIHKFILDYCTSVGYAVVIGRSKKTVPGLKKVLFVCDKAGNPPKRVQPELRKRKTSSRKCGCNFGFFAIEQRTQWTLRYRPDALHLKHNHGPSESPLHHPAARKLDSKMVAAVKALKENGTLRLLCSSRTQSSPFPVPRTTLTKAQQAWE